MTKKRGPQEYGNHAGWPGEGLSRLRIVFLALIALVGVSSSACGDGATDPPPPEPARATTVTVTPATAQLTALGATVRLSAQVLDQNGQAMASAAVAWSSGNATIAMVDGSGLVTAVQNGTVTITATSGSTSGSAAITVAQVAAGVTVTPTTVELTALGATVQLSAEVLDQNGNAMEGAAVAWSHADPSIATVDDAGLVTAVRNGMATVTATSGSASGSAAITVAQVAAGVTVTPATVELTALGSTVQLSAEVLDQNGNAMEGASVAWSHADPSIATVGDAGLVTAVGNGMATVTAISGSASGNATVTVAQVAAGVTVTPATVELTALGATVQLSAQVLDQNGQAMTGAAVVWSSGSVTIATVDDSGLVTAVGNGMATVTATSGSASGNATVTVAQVAAAVAVTPATVELTALGATVQLSAQVLDQNGQAMTGAAVVWSSGSVTIATVDDAGLVTAVGNGMATVTAMSGSASGIATVTVAQIAAAVTVTPTADTLSPGDTLRFSATAEDANGRAVVGAEFLWASSDVAVVTVDAAGLVMGVAAGEAEVTATSAGAMGRAVLVVTARTPATIRVTPGDLALAVRGGTVRLKAEVRDQLGRLMEDESVTWASSNTRVVTVDASGLATAVRIGTATITATAGRVSASATIMVVNRPPLVITGTAYVDPDILTSSDPSTFREARYAGRGNRLMFDRRQGWVTHNAFLFDATYSDGFRVEIQVNPEFETREAAQEQADRFGWLIGQIPIALRSSAFQTVWIHKGREAFGGRNNNVLIHTDEANWLAARGFLEEVLIHEATHTALDSIHASAPGWIQAQRDDMDFISTYARDHPSREDLAESFSMWMALRFREDRISRHLVATIRARMPHRLTYLDRQNFSMMPVR